MKIDVLNSLVYILERGITDTLLICVWSIGKCCPLLAAEISNENGVYFVDDIYWTNHMEKIINPVPEITRETVDHVMEKYFSMT